MKGDEDRLLVSSPTRRLHLHPVVVNNDNSGRNYSEFSSYDNDSPIDLRKKKPVPRSPRDDNDVDDDDEGSRRADDINRGPSVNADVTAEWLKNWQKMVAASTNPSLAHHLYYGGLSKNFINPPLPVQNPFLLNPLAFTGLGPLLCDQFGVRYALVRSPDGTQVMPVPLDRPQYEVMEEDSATSDKNYDSMKKHHRAYTERPLPIYGDDRKYEIRNPTKTNGHTPPPPPPPVPERRNLSLSSLPSHDSHRFKSTSIWQPRSASTPPDGGQRWSDITSFQERSSAWHFEPKSLMNGTKSHHPSSVRMTAEGAAKTPPHHYRTNLPQYSTERGEDNEDEDAEYEDDEEYEEAKMTWRTVAYRKRSLSCSRLPDHPHRRQHPKSRRFHPSGYVSDSELTFPRRQSSTALEKEPASFNAKVPRSFSEMRILRRPFSPYSSAPNTLSKRLKVARSLSESSLKRKPVVPQYPDPAFQRPKDTSVKVSCPPDPAQEHESFLQKLRHMAPAGFQWNVYGYYSHLMRKFQDQDTLKRYLGIDGSATYRPFPHPPPPPASMDAGLGEGVSPPVSPHSTSPGLNRRGSSGEADENGGDPNARKRTSRALTGKHVKHGTGASPATLLTLRQKIQERQRAKELGLINGRPTLLPSGRTKNTFPATKKVLSTGKGAKKAPNKVTAGTDSSSLLSPERRVDS